MLFEPAHGDRTACSRTLNGCGHPMVRAVSGSDADNRIKCVLNRSHSRIFSPMAQSEWLEIMPPSDTTSVNKAKNGRADRRKEGNGQTTRKSVWVTSRGDRGVGAFEDSVSAPPRKAAAFARILNFSAFEKARSAGEIALTVSGETLYLGRRH